MLNEALLLLARFHLKRKNYQAAKPLLLRIKKDSVAKHQAATLLAAAAFKTKDWELVLRQESSVRRLGEKFAIPLPPRLSALFRKARVKHSDERLLAGDFSAAESVLLPVLQENPRSLSVLVRLAELASRNEDWPTAVERWSLVRDRCATAAQPRPKRLRNARRTPRPELRAPQSPDLLPGRLRDARLKWADQLLRAHNPNAAEPLVLAVLADTPGDLAALVRLAKINHEKGNWEAVIRYVSVVRDTCELSSRPLPKPLPAHFRDACLKRADELLMAGDYSAAASVRRLTGDPHDRKNSPWNNSPVSLLGKARKPPLEKVTHIGVFGKGNAGDHLLPIILRDLFTHTEDIDHWQIRAARPEFSPSDIDKINSSKGAIIGGGGLFLRDTNTNQNSGWQWNCSVPHMLAIDVPMVVFAVGYNRFRGQPDFDPIFTDHVSALAKKCIYVGLRNQGSMAAIKSYLPEDLHSKIRYQPCLTAISKKLYPTLCVRSDPATSRPPVIALNMAFDRSELRFQGQEMEILISIAKAIKRLSASCSIQLVSHCADDNQFAPFLRSQQVSFEKIDLTKFQPEEILTYYTRVDLAIGMRGHSQMIPFGCGTPVLSLISHDKMRWFLDDINETENWGVELLDPRLEEAITTKANRILADRGAIQARIDAIQERLWDISTKNAADFRRALS